MIEVFFIVYLTLMPFEQRQNELVEKNPLVLEEFVKKETHVIARNDRCKKAEYPFTRIHIGPYVILGHLLVQNRQVRFNQYFNHQTVFE